MLHINFTYQAFVKQRMLLESYSTEIGWHGLVRPIEDGYEIYDIVVYPQVVTGGTVEVDQGEYGQWYFEHPDFDAIRYHAHSHVDFPSYPSAKDLESEAARHVPDDAFYIFMIWNRDMIYTARVYDHGTLIDQDEIKLTYDVIDRDFLADVSKLVKKQEVRRYESK